MRLFPLHIIKRDDGKPYLKRWTLLNLYFIKIRLHHILLSDYDCMHDHPWWFISFILKGGYWEYTPTDRKYDLFYPSERAKWYKPGSVLFRGAKFRHHIVLQEDQDTSKCLYKNIKDGGVLRPCWTLVIMGRSKRLWGFWSKTLGFIPHFNYHSSQKCD